MLGGRRFCLYKGDQMASEVVRLKIKFEEALESFEVIQFLALRQDQLYQSVVEVLGGLYFLLE